jgi:multiple sugar transport system substrate-binding protein
MPDLAHGMALVLSACAPASPEATTAPDKAPTEEAAATEAPAADPNAEPTPIVNAFGDCSDPLILWHGLTGTDGAVFATLLEQFSKENPDVCLRSEGIPWDTFFQKYPTATAAGNPPDMVIFHAAEVQQMAAEGLMTPLEDIMYADGTIKKADYNTTLIDQITVDGQTMAVPFDNHGWLLWYNKSLIALLKPEQPKKWDEFIEWAQADDGCERQER